MKTCGNCGASIADDAMFCVKCGTKVEVPEAAEAPAEETVAEEIVAEEAVVNETPVEQAEAVPVLSAKEEKAAAKAAAKADKEAAKTAAKEEKEAAKYSKAAAKAAKVMPTANSSAAIAAFVLSIAALFNFLNPIAAVISLLAIIFAIAGIVNTGRGKASGRGLAVTALILALVTLIIMASLVAVVIFVYDANVGAITENFDTAESIIKSVANILADEDFVESITDVVTKDEGIVINISDKNFTMTAK